jgi:hypothetical protein
MKEQLLDAWKIHNNLHYLLMDNITDTGMQATLSKRGGRTVYLQLCISTTFACNGWKFVQQTSLKSTR